MHKKNTLGVTVSVLVMFLTLVAFGEETEVYVGSVKVIIPGEVGKNIGVQMESVDCLAPAEIDEKTGLPVELGKVPWLTDFDEAVKRCKDTSKPIMLLFDEVPGCGGCKDFGRKALSNPLVLDAANEFVCCFVQNNSNDPQKRALLSRFKEPAWNNPVVRFVDADGKDLIPRKDGVYKTIALLRRMADALKTGNRDVPVWLELVGKQFADKTETATFAMSCYWTGEKDLGAIDGVVSTKIGVLGMEEVVEAEFNPEVVSYEKLLKKADQVKCTRHIFARNDEQAKSATNMLGKKKVTRTDAAVNAKTQQQYHLWHYRHYNYLPLLPIQATQINSALAKSESPDEFLSPEQLRLSKQILALVKADVKLASEVLKPLKPSRTAETMGEYMDELENVIRKAEKDRKIQDKAGGADE